MYIKIIINQEANFCKKIIDIIVVKRHDYTVIILYITNGLTSILENKISSPDFFSRSVQFILKPAAETQSRY